MTSMLLLNEYLPYTCAIVLILIIGLIEFISMLFGVNVLGLCDEAISNHVDVTDSNGLFKNVLGWLHIGRVPLLVLLIIFLAVFAMVGIAIHGLWVTDLSIYGVSSVACITALLAVHRSGRLLGKYFPNVNTTAVSQDSFIGLNATIVGHLVTHRNAAEAKLIDQHGHPHYILVKAAQSEASFVTGDAVVISARAGHLFYVTHPSCFFHT